MLISLSAISQTVYPRQAVIDSDTVGILSIEQVRTLNKTFVDLDECREMKDSLHSQIKTYDKLTMEQGHVITSQDKEIKLKQNIITEQQKILAIDEKMSNKMQQQIVWLKAQRIALSVGIIVLASVHFLVAK